MIDKTSVVGSLRILADKIQNSDSNAYDRLILISEAVQTGTNAQGWASSDIHKMIDSEGVVERYKSASAGLDGSVWFLEAIRNTFIFAPIIITWYGLSQAIDAYDKLIGPAVQAHNEVLYSQPFLYLWQQRFGGTLPSYLTLSNIALTDVAILAIILALTLLAYLLDKASSSAKERAAQQLRGQLMHVIAMASLCLRDQPQLTAGDNLENVARQINGMAQSIAGQFDSMAQKTVASFDTMVKDTAGRFAKMLTDLTGQFRTATQQTQEQLGKVVQEMMQQQQAGGKYLQQLGAFASGVVQISTEIQSAANELKTANVALVRSVDGLVGPTQMMSKLQEDLLGSVQQVAGLLQGTSSAMGDLVIRQQKMSAELTDVLDSLTLAVEKFERLAKDQGNMASQLASFLQHLQNEHDKQAQLAILTSDATVSLKNALEEMNKGSISLHRISVDMYDIARLQAQMSGLPQSSIVGVSDVLGGYVKAAQAMESSGNTLTASAIAIQRASQQLRDVLDDVTPRASGHGSQN